MMPPGLERYDWPPPPRVNWMLEGHEDAERTLRRAFEAGRLPHAWLIAGPRGIGKATLTFRFARFVLARGGERDGLASSAPLALESLPAVADLRVDPGLSVFRRVASGGHADLLTVERSVDEKRGKTRSEVVVDDVREIVPFLAHTPAEGGWRVVIVDSADDMNRSAANALLKALEEPPARSLLLLVSHAPGRLLPTLLSRCRRLMLKPLSDERVAALLRLYQPDIDADDATSVARLADGSIGRAIAMAERSGLELHKRLMELIAAMPNINAPDLHRFCEAVGRSGSDAAFDTVSELLCGWMSRLVRSAAVGGVDPDAAGHGPLDEERALIERLSAAAALDRWLEVWDKCTHLLARADAVNLERKQVLLNVFLTLENAVRG